MFAISSSTNHISIKYMGRIKKTSHTRPTYLTYSIALIIVCVFGYYYSCYPCWVTNAQTHLRWLSYGKNVVSFTSSLSCSPTLANWIHTTKLVLHCHIHHKVWATLRWKVGPPMIHLRFSKVHVRWFLNWIYTSFQLCFVAECGVCCKLWRHSPIHFNACVFMVFVLGSSPTPPATQV